VAKRLQLQCLALTLVSSSGSLGMSSPKAEECSECLARLEPALPQMQMMCTSSCCGDFKLQTSNRSTKSQTVYHNRTETSVHKKDASKMMKHLQSVCAFAPFLENIALYFSSFDSFKQEVGTQKNYTRGPNHAG
jgi:hypothetical protein